MLKYNILTALTIFALSITASPLHAQATEQAEQVKMDLTDFIDTLDDSAISHFMSIYTNHNIIRTVTTIRQDVLNATASCSEKNPEMKSDIDKRFNQWTNAIDPVIEEAQNFLNNKIIAQNYAEEETLKDFLEDADELRAVYRDKFKKIPVTSKEGCSYMLNKMDETQDELTQLLRGTLLVNAPLIEESPIRETPRPEETKEQEPSETTPE